MPMSLLFPLLGRVAVEDADDLRGGTVFSTAREVRLAFIQPEFGRLLVIALCVLKYWMCRCMSPRVTFETTSDSVKVSDDS